MGTTRYATDDDGQHVELTDHEGYVAKVYADGTDTSGGLLAEIDRRTVAHRAACSCGWRGAATLPREPGATCWPEWEDVPDLDAEWEAHTDPLLEALAHPGPAPDIHAVRATLDAVRAKVRRDIEPDDPDTAAVVLARLTDAGAHLAAALDHLRHHPTAQEQ